MNINLSSFINKNQKIAVAVSGGADSMALLHFLSSASGEFGFSVLAINIEHGIRGASSLSDSRFVSDYCKAANIPLLSFSVDSVKKAETDKLSIEQAARILRYDAFSSAISSGFCDKVATAHHQCDNTETVLFNLFRGSAIKGVCGIPKCSGDIIRPFIFTPKSEILEYIKENNIPYITDETNFDDNYTRNYLRLNIIPEIKKIFPEVDSAISRFSAIAKEEDEFLDKLATKNLIFGGTIQILLPLAKPLLARALFIALKKLGVTKDYEKFHSELLYELSLKNNGDKLSLPKNITAIKEYDRLTLYVEKIAPTLEIPFSLGEHIFSDGILTIAKTDTLNFKDGLYIDFDKMPTTAVIRLRKEGDVFTPYNGKNKKLKEYFIDKKIPLRLRNGLPVIADGKNIIFIAGIQISDSVKVDKTTLNVVKLTYTNF